MMKRIRIKTTIIMLVIILIIFVPVFLYYFFNVKAVNVKGNIRYTRDEIKDMVMSGKLGNNSLYLRIKYKDRDIKDIPFIEKMNVEITARDEINIVVYEKTIAGYIDYLGKFLYFDKDGIIVESQDVKLNKIPKISGLDYNSLALYEKLPIEDEELFTVILNLTQLVARNNIPAEEIYFDDMGNITLYYDKISVLLGPAVNIEQKLMQLGGIIGELEGRCGELDLTNFDENTKVFSFHKMDENSR